MSAVPKAVRRRPARRRPGPWAPVVSPGPRPREPLPLDPMPRGREGIEGIALVDPDEIVDVAPCVPDPDVEAVRGGHPPGRMLRRLAEQAELFVRAARLDAAALGRALTGLEPGDGR